MSDDQINGAAGGSEAAAAVQRTRGHRQRDCLLCVQVREARVCVCVRRSGTTVCSTMPLSCECVRVYGTTCIWSESTADYKARVLMCSCYCSKKEEEELLVLLVYKAFFFFFPPLHKVEHLTPCKLNQYIVVLYCWLVSSSRPTQIKCNFPLTPPPNMQNEISALLVIALLFGRISTSHSKLKSFSIHHDTNY